MDLGPAFAASEKRRNDGQWHVHLDVFVAIKAKGDLPGDSLTVRSVNTTESHATFLVEPVGEELNPIFLLKRQIFQMRLSDLYCGYPLNLMSI
jgi:hypothetical protein